MNRTTKTQAEVVVPSESWAWEPDDVGGGSLIDVLPDDLPPPYATRWARPGTQLAARIALWGAVAIGCLGGIVGMARPSATPMPVGSAEGEDEDGVPAPVAGTAERAVAAWLRADDAGEAAMAALFVDAPAQPRQGADPLTVGDASAVRGHSVGDGFWWVTVAVDVTEVVSPGDDGLDASGDDETSRSTWYVEVGVVGDLETGLAALATPAVLPAAPPLPDRWSVDDGGLDLGPDDDRYVTVEGFLRALLVGEGDPSRYMAPGQSVELPATPLFADVDVAEMAMTGEPDDGEVRVWVEAEVETRAGARRLVSYSVRMAEREGRWEVVDLPGNPLVEVSPAPAGGAPATTAPPSTEAEVDEPSSGGASTPTTLLGEDAVVD